ncbi:hypothetical protein ZIOFF_068972 [Zingiber officinale]|uniref:SAUR family protein n=1 Tax=Zingiber officinale TaxID=94328 RepID=A0A8J5EUX6_ZINOF|nr:hypothetical protein ZIOFF_068972 [Zingiber officinale]
MYVGKSRRKYLVSDDLVGHPLFRVLVERCSDNADAETVVVGCEVVLFEHLPSMLENAGPCEQFRLLPLENAGPHPESPDELVEFYAC